MAGKIARSFKSATWLVIEKFSKVNGGRKVYLAGKKYLYENDVTLHGNHNILPFWMRG
jgi:hypothetical protein